MNKFLRAILYASAIITAAVFIFIVGYILIKGVPYLKPSLFAPKYTSDNVSMLPSIINTLIMTLLSLLAAVPLGVSAAIYMEEYSRRGSRLAKAVGVTAQTLSGIPSIVYGLFGMLFFVTALGWGYSILAGAATEAIMILPLIMRTSQEALKSVPDNLREGSFALGAPRFRTVAKIVLPAAMPGILSGIILATGRVVGETASLIYTAGTVANLPQNLFSSGRTLSVHMYALSREALHTNEAYATAVVLLVTVIAINALSNAVARKFARF